MTTPISKPTLQAFLFDSGIDPVHCFIHTPDELYALPDAEWIATDFARAFAPHRDAVVGQYEQGESDCDDYSGCAKAFADGLHRRSENRPRNCGLAFAEFHFQRGGNGPGHAINAAVCREGERLQLVFFEPQRAAVIELTPEEIGSAFLVKF